MFKILKQKLAVAVIPLLIFIKKLDITLTSCTLSKIILEYKAQLGSFREHLTRFLLVVGVLSLFISKMSGKWLDPYGSSNTIQLDLFNKFDIVV